VEYTENITAMLRFKASWQSELGYKVEDSESLHHLKHASHIQLPQVLDKVFK